MEYGLSGIVCQVDPKQAIYSGRTFMTLGRWHIQQQLVWQSLKGIRMYIMVIAQPNMFVQAMLTRMNMSSICLNAMAIEYDTTAGRKRGYVPSSSLTLLGDNLRHNGDFYLMEELFTGTITYIAEKYDVYSGLNTVYTKIGSVSAMNITILADTSNLNNNSSYSTYYIKYDVDGTSQKKSGFIFVPR